MHGCTAKVEAAESACGKKANGGGHDEIVGTDFEMTFIAGAKFVNGMMTSVQKDCAGNRTAVRHSEDNKTIAGVNDFLPQVLKKNPRLGWRAVTAAGPDMKLIVGAHRGFIRPDFSLNAFPFRFADGLTK